MSLTSYRAAPPRDKPLRAFDGSRKRARQRRWRRSVRHGGFLRRRPGPKPLGAWAMYQRPPALERAAADLFGIFSAGRCNIAEKRRRDRRSKGHGGIRRWKHSILWWSAAARGAA